MMADYKKLEEYGIIGNLDTCALISVAGSIDWCCFPHIESPAVFAGILDIEKGGHFAIRPSGSFDSHQQYLEKTNVLQTVFKTSNGQVTLTDFMPIKSFDKDEEIIHQTIYRMIYCDSGPVNIELDFMPRFNYAQTLPSFDNTKAGAIAYGINEHIRLITPIECIRELGKVTGNYKLKEGTTIWNILRYDHDTYTDVKICEQALSETMQYWNEWAHKCTKDSICMFYGKWHDMIVRSALTLKLLTHHETGSISAAPTTSLPEVIGGPRNWDYRYNWVRDSAFTVQALYNLGHDSEAKKHLNWFKNISDIVNDPSKIQIMYGMHGEPEMDEKELTHLSGYRDSSPVRIGNLAAKQQQLDIYGELVNAFYETTRYGEEITDDDWKKIQTIVDYVSNIWETKDSGIWEMRGEPQHFVYSKLMCWVALDRGIKIVELKGFSAPIDYWKENRDKIKAAILEKGFNKDLNSFVQAFDSDVLDATSLLIPMMGLIPFYDPRVQSTIDATLKHLATDAGYVFRYLSDDGLEGKEGAFILCSFWLVNALALSGRTAEAEKIFNSILSHISPLGLLSEEISPETGELLGNFPQAFSHIGLINSALYLGGAMGRKQIGPEPIGRI